MRRPGLALASLTLALGACATPGPDVPALVEVETVTPPLQGGRARGIYLVTVSEDGSVERRLHHWSDTATAGAEPEQTLAPEELQMLRDLLATPVAAEQTGAPFDANEFRITAHGSPGWSIECDELEVHRCPIAFLKLWQSLDEIIGDLPER